MTLSTDSSTRPADRPSVVRPPSARGRLSWAVVGRCFLGVSIDHLDGARASIGGIQNLAADLERVEPLPAPATVPTQGAAA